MRPTTAQRRDGHHSMITMQWGPVRRALTQSAQVEAATLRVLVERHTGFDPTRLPQGPGHPGDPQRWADDVYSARHGSSRLARVRYVARSASVGGRRAARAAG